MCRYLGAKLRHGRQPLYTSGLDEQAKRFSSLHAVQRHMVDSNRCSMCYDGNEDEYEDYYEYPYACPRSVPARLLCLFALRACSMSALCCEARSLQRYQCHESCVVRAGGEQ